MVRHALLLAQNVIIGITNPDAAQRRAHPTSAHRHLDAANPFSYAQRERLIEAALQCECIPQSRYRIVPFPLEEPERWHTLLEAGTPQLVRVFSDWEREKVRRFTAADYPVVVLEGNPSTRISGTDVRSQMARGDTQLGAVPPGARELLASWCTNRAGHEHA